ncbi:TraR/DksA C4-type zinc finger protein [Erwinia sp. V90_4]|uniref:TraR/DksA C4-type zinc finger protein n=1 Tax=Erwinia sp. V90_4 TaxID=3044239 RepID=UPI00249EB066|nr:TraR/DksA C4-type zinc finger protein [Erwinia sp. V90_4]MDI3442282.1 TraR/DksA C4-type zinc finger protein [Erwinia sp. V90_4]
MADEMDRAQQREAENLARHLARAVQRPMQPSAFFCEACGESIPLARRKALDGVTLCVSCKEIDEHQAKHCRSPLA